MRHWACMQEFFIRGAMCERERDVIFTFRARGLASDGKNIWDLSPDIHVSGVPAYGKLSVHSGVKDRLSYCFGFLMMAVCTYDR
jgi:hypothetical protein